MKRVIGLGALILIMATTAFGPAAAQDNSEATISALQTQVAELKATVDARGQKINAQRTQIAELKTNSSQSDSTNSEPVPTSFPTVDPNAPRGTRENPVPVGTPIKLGDWVVTVLSSSPNATEQVMAENMFNEPPGEGRQFFIVRVRIEYQGTSSDTFIYSVSLSAVGQSNVAYTGGFDNYCGVTPEEIPSSEVFPGGVIEGNVCWSVKSEDVETLIMYADEGFSNDNRVYFATK